MYLLTDEHPSAAQREQSVETLLHMFEVGHWQWCMELSITAVLKSGDSKGYDTIHHRYLPHPLIHSPCASLGDIFKTQICFRNTTLIHILQWFPVAHRKKKKKILTMALRGLALPISSTSCTILLSLPFSQAGIISFPQKSHSLCTCSSYCLEYSAQPHLQAS